MSEQNMGEAPAPIPSEPNVHSGGEQEPGGLVPPYEGHQESGQSQEELAKDPQKAGPGSAAGAREVSEAERAGVSDTDTTGASPLGVGESTTKPGNERMANKSEGAQHSERTEHGIGGKPENLQPDMPEAVTGK